MRTVSKKDFYSTLGVLPTASLVEIKDRFRFLCHAYHPDKFVGDTHRHAAEQEFKKINEAYQILSDPVERLRFDALRTPRSEAPRKDSPPKTSDTPKSAARPTQKAQRHPSSTILSPIIEYFFGARTALITAIFTIALLICVAVGLIIIAVAF